MLCFIQFFDCNFRLLAQRGILIPYHYKAATIIVNEYLTMENKRSQVSFVLLKIKTAIKMILGVVNVLVA